MAPFASFIDSTFTTRREYEAARQAEEQKEPADKLRVYSTPFTDEIKEAVMGKMLDGGEDFLKFAWDMVSSGGQWPFARLPSPQPEFVIVCSRSRMDTFPS